MTKNNEQIIDDLDTRCPYHCSDKVGQCNNPSQETPHTYCIDNKDCIYKQYARKEQECEELKAKCKKYGEINEQETKDYAELWKQLDQLKEDNEELKIKYSQLEKDNLEEHANWCDTKWSIQWRNIALIEENKKLKQTLEEIREICNKTLCDYLQCSLNYNHSKDFECEKTSCNRAKRRKFILKILQKINEVIDD